MTPIPKPAKRGPKPRRPIKRGKRPRRQRKSTLAELKRELWRLVSGYVKERDGNTCFSCGRGALTGRNWQAGHLFPAGMASLIRYEPKNVHSQCYHCNINLGGNGAAYADRFVGVYGFDEFARLARLARQTKAWRSPEIRELIAAIERSGAHYESLYAERYGL